MATADHVLDKDHPHQQLINLIWKTIRKDKYSTDDVVRNLFFKSNTEIEYVRPAPRKPRVGWINMDIDGSVGDLPNNCYLGKIYVQMPMDFNSRKESIEAYMTRKRFFATD